MTTGTVSLDVTSYGQGYVTGRRNLLHRALLSWGGSPSGGGGGGTDPPSDVSGELSGAPIRQVGTPRTPRRLPSNNTTDEHNDGILFTKDNKLKIA